jgi:hypothetical protein
MPSFPNFFETKAEAMIRLRQTVVLYDGLPYYVLGVTDHKPDGILRIYLDPIGQPQGVTQDRAGPWQNIPMESTDFGPAMDAYLESNKNSVILRKQMNSPLFNKFRPFPLGMTNQEGDAFYIERQPNRKTEQGLIRTMLTERRVGEPGLASNSLQFISITSSAMKDCITGNLPTAQFALKALLDPSVENRSIAFDRKFALLRGSLDDIYLSYKGETVGLLPDDDFSVLALGRMFSHVRESVYDLNLFLTINERKRG